MYPIDISTISVILYSHDHVYDLTIMSGAGGDGDGVTGQKADKSVTSTFVSVKPCCACSVCRNGNKIFLTRSQDVSCCLCRDQNRHQKPKLDLSLILSVFLASVKYAAYRVIKSHFPIRSNL